MNESENERTRLKIEFFLIMLIISTTLVLSGYTIEERIFEETQEIINIPLLQGVSMIPFNQQILHDSENILQDFNSISFAAKQSAFVKRLLCLLYSIKHSPLFLRHLIHCDIASFGS